jgi:hypothetical protein
MVAVSARAVLYTLVRKREFAWVAIRRSATSGAHRQAHHRYIVYCGGGRYIVYCGGGRQIVNCGCYCGGREHLFNGLYFHFHGGLFVILRREIVSQGSQ